jgi:GNAT superfamily N-acetyltransferase
MPVEIRPVRSRKELHAFIRLPFRLYADAPNWVPPLIADRKRFLDRSKNPFFEHGEAEYFLAYRGDRVVGRITAQVDRNLQAFQGNRWGQFGFFECEDDQEAATALLQRAEAWVTDKGCDRLVGPFDFTTNDECGVLVEGFDRLPVVLMNWTHPYYPRLIEEAGLTKAMDTLMWSLDVVNRDQVHPAIWEMAEKVASEHKITCRGMRKRDLEEEVGRFLEVYNEAWERNWGFVPLTESEVRHYAKQLRPILDENWAMIAETADGRVAGAALTLPDYNQVFKHMNGRLFPFGWAKFLYYRRKIDRVRVFALGVKKEFQHTGVAARFYQMHYDAAERTPQSVGETGWILETNKPMNRAMEGMGGKVVCRYRIFEREIEQPAGEPELEAATAV